MGQIIMGSYSGYDAPASHTSYMTALGVTPSNTILMDFLADTNWTDCFGAFSGQGDFAAFTGLKMMGVSMQVQSAPRTWTDVTGGGQDANFTSFFTSAHADGIQFIRMGWEYNLGAFAWAVGGGNDNPTNKAGFIATWQHIWNLAHAVAPGYFKFVFNPTYGASGLMSNWADYYPGDTYVDIIGLDIYDTLWNQPNYTNATYESALASDPPGPADIVAFATSHGKQLMLPEWGTWDQSNAPNTNDSPGDDPTFVTNRMNWAITQAEAGFTVYMVVWNDPADPTGIISGYPNSLAALKTSISTAKADGLIDGGTPSATVILTAPGIASLTQAQYNQLAAWGVGGIVVGSNSGGGASWPFGFGGAVPFNSSGSNTFQNQLAAAAVKAHSAGIKVYLGIYLQNFDWSTAITTNPAPCLGNWNPTFVDANGHGWGDQTTIGSWFKMCFDYGAAVAQMNVDGMYWDTEGGGVGKPPSPIVTSCVLNGTTTIHPASGTFGHILVGATVTGTDIPSGTVVSSGSNGGTSITLSHAATGSTTTNLTFSNPGGTDFVVWQWKNTNNGYGSSSSLAQQNTWAQTAGASMMAAINAGFQSLGGNSVISGTQVPIVTYQSTVAGLPQILNGYLDVANTFTGTTVSLPGQGSVSYHTGIGNSTWASFLTGVASQTTGPVVLGDSTFYWQGIVTSGGPYSSDSDGGWARALTANRAALAALGLGSNIAISPFVWPYDATSANGGGGVWTQAEWTKAIGPILAGLEANTYSIFQFTNLLSGSTLVTNYASNPNSSPAGANYTPLSQPLAQAIAESSLSADVVSRADPHPRSLAETSASVDAITRIRGQHRSVAESSASSDSATRSVRFQRSIADASLSADTLGGAQNNRTRYSGLLGQALLGQGPLGGPGAEPSGNVAKSLAESSASVDTIVRTSQRPRSLAETSTGSDALSRTLHAPGAIAQTSATVDTVGRTVHRFRSPAESSLSTDLVVGTRQKFATLAETSATVDTLTAQDPRHRSLSESSLTADAVAGQSTSPGSIAETSASVDTALANAALPRALAEVSAASDAVARTAGPSRLVAESSLSSDLVSTGPQLIRTSGLLGQGLLGLGLLGGPNPVQARISTAIAEFSVSVDSLAISGPRARAIAETSLSVDTPVRVPTQTRMLTEGAVSSDAVSASGRTKARAVGEASISFDVVSPSMARPRAIAETSLSVDALARQGGSGRTLADTSVSIDAVTRLTSLPRLVAESSSSTDVVRGHTADQRMLAEASVSQDTTASPVQHPRVLSENSASGDTAAHVVAYSRLVVELSSSNDATSRQLAATRAVPEFSVSVDGVGAPASRVVVEFSVSVDSVTSTPAHVTHPGYLRLSVAPTGYMVLGVTATGYLDLSVVPVSPGG